MSHITLSFLGDEKHRHETESKSSMHLEELGLANETMKKHQSSLGTNLTKVTASHKDIGVSCPSDPARLKNHIDHDNSDIP
jgi:hypothetical protein